MLERNAADQVLGLKDVVHLPARQDEANRVAKRVYARADLGAQAAARTPARLIFAPPFAPAACWWARTMVESMIRYSKSGFSTNAWKIRSQAPFLAQRRKRWKTLFQLPNSGGRSRQGAPARAIHSTASTNKPIVVAVPPFVSLLTRNKPFDALPLRVRQFLPNQGRLPSCDLESHSRVKGNPLYVNRT